ncbi:MAG: hypothetical protein CMP91_01600 [Gammaproteobacteria bacterium]|nr:hypothetical protein [Gammaproteobacteria bacterium]MAY01879.1 hypothetical protein [Gammaproteobacteria bacterium]|tara:strand:+ start:4607 stop:5089 length:483 start_codon:yes stop_codon:yes gene_type:complete
MDFGCFEPVGLVCSIEMSPVGQWVYGYYGNFWAYPAILSAHGLGMMTVMGVVLAFNMRVLGFANNISISAYDRLFMIGWAGFILNLVSGLLLLSGALSTFLYQGAFQLKMAMILLGGILMKVIMNGIRSGRDEKMTMLISAVCLASWTGAIITGRLMAYL